MKSAVLYSDAAWCRRGRNKGNGRWGYEVRDILGKLVCHDMGELKAPNFRVAEAKAMHIGMEKALSLGVEVVHVRSDCLPLIRQLQGRYIPDYALINEIKAMESGFDGVHYAHLPRTHPMIERIDASLKEEWE